MHQLRQSCVHFGWYLFKLVQYTRANALDHSRRFRPHPIQRHALRRACLEETKWRPPYILGIILLFGKMYLTSQNHLSSVICSLIIAQATVTTRQQFRLFFQKANNVQSLQLPFFGLG